MYENFPFLIKQDFPFVCYAKFTVHYAKYPLKNYHANTRDFKLDLIRISTTLRED